MRVKNRLKHLLNEAGIESLRPTPELLEKRLGGMTIHRFNQIWENSSKTELTMLEVSLLNSWLSMLFGHEVDVIESVAVSI